MAESNISSDFPSVLQSEDDDFSSDDDSCFVEPPSLKCLKYFSEMNVFRKQRKYCDLEVIIGKITFLCHRIVLVSASKYFRESLDSSVEGKRKIKVDFAIEPKFFENVLEFIYGVRMDINSKNAHHLLQASKFFGIVELEDYCARWLEQKLPKQHIFETCMLAHSAGKFELYGKTVKYIAKNIVALSKNDTFLGLCDEILEDIIKHEDLTCSQDLIIELISRLKGNGNTSEKVPSSNPSAGDSEKVAAKDDLNEYFHEAVEGQSLHVRVGYLKNSKHFIQGFIYDDFNQKWKHDKNYPKKIVSEKNIVMNGEIYTISTDNWTDIGKPSHQFQVKSVDQEAPTVLSQPPSTSSKCTSLAVACNIIYYYIDKDIISDINGLYMMPNTTSGMARSDQIFAYIRSHNEKIWYCVHKPQYETTNACITSLDNLLYLVSGSPLAFAQYYDHRSPKWISIPTPSYTHVNGAASSHNGKLYVLGSSAVFEVFDRRAGRWEILPNASYKYMCPKLVNYRDKLWAFGHSNDVSLESTDLPVEWYNPITNEWCSSELLKIKTGCYDTEIVDAFVFEESLKV